MATKRMKEDSEMVVDEEPVLEDRISMLPDDVILLILSLIPTIVAIRTSILSKRWRHLWTSVSMIDIDISRDVHYFRQHNRDSTGRKKLIKFLDRFFKYPLANTAVSRFKFRIMFNGGNNRVDAWLWYPILKNVKEFDLYVGTRIAYTLPYFILNLKQLTSLRLSCLVLDTNSLVRLPLLKDLYLGNVELDGRVVDNLFSGCPLIEKLRMCSCSGVSNLEISSSSLKHAEILNCCRGIKVKAVNLESFVFSGDYYGKCRIDLAQCLAIRSVSFTRDCLDEQWLENWLPKLTFLESLNLSNCHRMKSVKIRNPHLKSFVFDSDQKLDSLDATIDTPGLEYFYYRGISMFKISVNAPNLVNANIRIPDYPRKIYDTEWYVALIEFLSEFNGCKSVNLFCSSKKALIVPDELRTIHGPPFPDLKNLKVKVPGSALHKKIVFRNSLLWIAPSLETLTIE